MATRSGRTRTSSASASRPAVVSTRAGSGPPQGQHAAGAQQRSISPAAEPSKGAPPPFGAAVTADVLAGLLGIAPRTVRELAGRGLVVKAGRGRYDAATSVAAYCAHLREQAAGRAGDAQAGLTVERARREKEAADNLALRNAALRRDLVSATEVTAEWSGILRQLRARILAVPSRVNQRLPFLKPGDVAEIDAEVREALTEVARDGAPA